MQLSLGEEYLLLALDNEKGTFATWANYGLAGALLMDLVRQERLAVDGKTVTLRDATPTGDPVLDRMLGKVALAKRPKAMSEWVGAFAIDSSYRHPLVQRLVAAGILAEERHEFLRLIPYTRYPEQLAAPEAEIVGELRSVLLGGAQPELRTATLVALLEASSLMGAVLSPQERKQARETIQGITKGDAAGKAIAEALSDCTAAVSAAVMICCTS